MAAEARKPAAGSRSGRRQRRTQDARKARRAGGGSGRRQRPGMAPQELPEARQAGPAVRPSKSPGTTKRRPCGRPGRSGGPFILFCGDPVGRSSGGFRARGRRGRAAGYDANLFRKIFRRDHHGPLWAVSRGGGPGLQEYAANWPRRVLALSWSSWRPVSGFRRPASHALKDPRPDVSGAGKAPRAAGAACTAKRTPAGRDSCRKAAGQRPQGSGAAAARQRGSGRRFWPAWLPAGPFPGPSWAGPGNARRAQNRA